MALTRIQASDFQDAGVKGNLSKLEVIAQFANDSKTAGVDLVGDIFDAHAMDEVQKQYNTGEAVSNLEKDPNIKKLTDRRTAFINHLLEKYGDSFYEKIQNNQFEPDELKEFDDMDKRLKEVGIPAANAVDSQMAIKRYYAECANRIGGIKSPVYAIRGNNDLNFMQEIVKARYPELERKLLEDGPFRIIGMNNTNHPGGGLIEEYGNLAVPSDSQEAYDTYNLKKTGGKKANVIMMHDPPNTKGAEGIVKLIQEHVQPGKFLLVECGHVPGAELTAVKDKDGKGGYVIARSSNDTVFKHVFDDDGNYLKTKIYGYST
jgi:Icc-related predicted phosphoesterase